MRGFAPSRLASHREPAGGCRRHQTFATSRRSPCCKRGQRRNDPRPQTRPPLPATSAKTAPKVPYRGADPPAAEPLVRQRGGARPGWWSRRTAKYERQGILVRSNACLQCSAAGKRNHVAVHVQQPARARPRGQRFCVRAGQPAERRDVHRACLHEMRPTDSAFRRARGGSGRPERLGRPH